MELTFKQYMDKRTSGKILCFVTVLLTFFITLWQTYTVLTFNCVQNYESGLLYNLAKFSAENNTFYPSISNLYDAEIFSPGYVNYLSLLLKIHGGVRFALLCNVALTLLLAFLIYFVASRVFQRRGVGFISVIIYELTLSYTCSVLLFRSEILLSVALLGGFALCLSKLKGRYIFAGIVLAFACWVNLISVVFIGAVIAYLLLKKYGSGSVTKMLVSLACVVLVIQSASFYISGYSAFVSPVSGKSVMESANDFVGSSEGAATVFREGNAGYIPNAGSMTFIEKNNYWLAKSGDWISDNFGSYIAQTPTKLFNIYAPDTHYIYSYYMNLPFNGGGDFTTAATNLFTFNFSGLSWVDSLMLFDHFVYWLTLLMTVVTAVFFVVTKRHRRAILPLLLFPAVSTVIYLFGATHSVMHVVFMPIFIIIASAGIGEMFMKKCTETAEEQSGQQVIVEQN
ncbi:MAG: hypothetical protein IKY44_04440 [Clostridia bacterium]|nr:hypothetical protein [Clostridia bacterium]